MSDGSALQDYEHVFKAFLGRHLNDTERDAVQTKFEAAFSRDDLVDLLRAVVSSDEYFALTREEFARRLFPESCIVAAKTPFGDEVLVDLRQFHLGFAIATGHFEPHETAFVRRHVRRGYRVLDIGANIGYFTTAFARLVGNSGCVYAFEPVGETYRKLVAAINRNRLENIVTAYNIALSDSDGHVDMVFEKASTNIGAAHFARHDQNGGNLCFERVSTKRLDDVIGRMPIDFVKIDVEGAEWLVIEGAGNVFRDQKPIVMIEFNSSQLEAVSRVAPSLLLSGLMELGFEPHEILHDGDVRKFADPQAGLSEALARTGIANLVLAKESLT